MATDQKSGLMQHLRRILRDDAGLTDGTLLKDFISRRDETAFAVLVGRHGPMVWGVCRRFLRDHHDAEDAFQATFLVLVRRASSIASRELLANWLHGVAHRTALKARATAARRAEREKQVMEMPDRAGAQQGPWCDRQLVLDEELSRLPEKYRGVIVLCDLEGRTRKEVAGQLGCAEGTVASRLARARIMLAHRLTRRGVAWSGGALAAVLSEQAASGVPNAVVVSTIQAAIRYAAVKTAATGAISLQVAALTEGVMNAMMMSKLKATLAGLVLIALAVGLGVLYPMQAAELGQAAPVSRVAGWEEPIPQPLPAMEKPEEANRAGKAEFQEPKGNSAPVKKFPNAVGWSWYDAPRLRTEFGTSASSSHISGAGYSVLFELDKDDALLVYMAYEVNQAALKYRPVVFDDGGKRYVLTDAGGGGHHKTRLARFRLDPKELPAAKAVYLGIEKLAPDGRKAVADDAAERAKKAGVEVLRFPESGRVYEFAVTTMEGKKIRTEDFRGKVVVIDCWASWCSPCMSLMPDLKRLYEKHHKDGLEIIGVCFDHDAEKAKKSVEAHGLKWQQVLVPEDEKSRELWGEASGIEAIPRLLVIDRDGILRADCGPDELSEQLTKLLKATPRR